VAIHNRHDFQAFSTLGRANLRAAALGHSESCVDEAFFFIQRISVAKFVGDIRQNLTQHLAAAPSLKPAMHRFVVRITPRQHVPLRPAVQNPQHRFHNLPCRNRFATGATIRDVLLGKMIPDTFPPCIAKTLFRNFDAANRRGSVRRGALPNNFYPSSCRVPHRSNFDKIPRGWRPIT
jgi:hypothetical protein